jgi:hypothetical protein
LQEFLWNGCRIVREVLFPEQAGEKREVNLSVSLGLGCEDATFGQLSVLWQLVVDCVVTTGAETDPVLASRKVFAAATTDEVV